MQGVTVSLWRSKNTILKCYSAEVAGNSANAKMQNSQMGQFGDYSDLGAEKKKCKQLFQWNMNKCVGFLSQPERLETLFKPSTLRPN